MTLNEIEGVANRAVGAGGMAHLSGVMTASFSQVTAVDNEAGGAGGAFAVVESDRQLSTITKSTINANKAGSTAGGLYVENSAVSMTGTQLRSNWVELGDGGAAALSGEDAHLALSDTECVNVVAVLDWTAAGEGCPLDGTSYGGPCDSFAGTCEYLQDQGNNCNGCACNK